MSAKHTIAINGRVYDAVTGLQIGGAEATHVPAKKASSPKKATHMDIARPRAKTARAVHHTARKSTTLRRSHLVAPKSKTPISSGVKRSTTKTSRSPMIAHFASHPQPLPKHPTSTYIAQSSESSVLTPVSQTFSHSPSAVEVKERLLAHASTKIDPKKKAAPAKTKRTLFKNPLKSRHIVTASIAVVLLTGYFTYLSMPGLSVRLAASQSGVAASYPDYQPDGYSFEGPVAFQQGEVTVRFKSNGGGNGFTIHQRASNWNSVAVLDNLVDEASNGKYSTTSEGGVIIYTYGNNAAWSNGGVLYTIDGNAPLNTEQLVRIASSM